MYCHNCGREIDKTVKFCPYCGSEQEKPMHQPGGHCSGYNRKLPIVLIGLAAVILVVLGLLAGRNISAHIGDTQNVIEEPTSTESQIRVESQISVDGWHIENGKRYYIHNGQRYVDLQEVDGELYYFGEDGVLAVDQDVPYGGIILHANQTGCLEGMTIEELFGTWAEEDYHFGNSGSGAVLELSTEVEDCDFFRFCLEANGMYGAKVNGKWKIHIRHNGKWEFVQDINYTEPEGYFDIHFETPRSFDAITAYPTMKGNASYYPLFYLENVHCLF